MSHKRDTQHLPVSGGCAPSASPVVVSPATRDFGVAPWRWPVNQRTILIVDEDSALRDTIAYNLRGEDYVVLTAGDGLTALDITRHNPLMLVLLDIMLPRLDGLELCRQLRARPETRNVPVLVLSSRDDEADKVLALEVGADDYVIKPFSWPELRSRIRALLRRSALGGHDAHMPSDNATLHFSQNGARVHDVGPLHVDADQRLVTKAGTPIELKRKLFDLLVYMVRFRGSVLTRERLLEHVWGYEYGGDTRTVDVHICWLRERIEDDPANPQWIRTVRGVGYRFSE